MNNELPPENLITEICELPTGQFRLLLVRYVASLTIAARMHFADKEYESAQSCNETLHKILGFLADDLALGRMGNRRSMTELVVTGAGHHNRLSMVKKALSGVRSPDNT